MSKAASMCRVYPFIMWGTTCGFFEKVFFNSVVQACSSTYSSCLPAPIYMYIYIYTSNVAEDDPLIEKNGILGEAHQKMGLHGFGGKNSPN